MNQEKIGKFIAEMRKEKNMTQVDLANKLGITDRAISKWENGRGMPDLSLIKPLCNELKITINDLLSGEKLNESEYQEKLEENILKTIDYTDKKIIKTKKIFKTIITVISILILSLIIMFIVDINRMNNNLPVLFSTWGYTYTPSIDLNEVEIELAIYRYLEEKNDNQSKHHEIEKWFSSYNTYLLEEKIKDELYNVYTFVLQKNYYKENNQILEESSSAIPYKFIVKRQDDHFTVIESIIPRDGNLYQNDMQQIFPKYIIKDIENIYYDEIFKKLELDIKRQVDLYFHQ